MDDSYVFSFYEPFFGDIDNDGDLDMMAAGSRSVAWFENLDGQGTFSSRNSIATYGFTHYVVSRSLADLDGDGDLDALVAVDWPERIYMFENLDGNGTFGPERIVAAFTGPIYVADMDGDSDLDILVHSPQRNNQVSWLKNLDGLGHFGSETIIASEVYGPKGLISVDLDGDNDNDVLLGSYNFDKIIWFKNLDGNGNFGSEIIISDLENDPTSVFPTDMDSDGDLDILVSSSSAWGRIAWYENMDGQGTFGPWHEVESDLDDPATLYAADIDNDGDNDILASASHMGDDFISYYENLDGQGSFGTSHLISNEIADPSYLKTADVDNDGKLDVTSSSFGDGKMAWYKNIDGNTFGQQQLISEDVEGAKNVFTADLDGDGDMDLLAASESFNGQPGNSKISWFENIDGRGRLSRQKIIGYLRDALLVRATDVDGDGDLDVIGASFSSSESGIVIYKNTDGLGNFVESLNLTSGLNQMTSIETADFDGDDDMDILYTSWNGNGWIENMDGQGNYQDFHPLTPGGGFHSIACTDDLDGDGDMDIITWHLSYGTKVIWFENLGGGNFDPAKLIQGIDHGSYIQDIKIADMDMDGDKDVVVNTTSSDEYIIWVENLDGNGNFGNPTIILTNESTPNRITVGDFDNDNDMDVAFTSVFHDLIGWLENLDGNGNFGPINILSNEILEPISITSTDLDTDGDLDILAVSELVNTIALYKNSLILSLYENNTLNFKVYPNPSSGVMNIQLETKIKTIRVYNSLGQEVLLKTDADNIDISSLEMGIYYLKVIDINDKEGTSQIIKN